MFLSCSFSYDRTKKLSIKSKVIAIVILGIVFFTESLRGQSTHPSYKDSSQTITVEELRERMALEKNRSDSSRDLRKKTRAADKKSQKMHGQDSLKSEKRQKHAEKPDIKKPKNPLP